MNWKSLRRALVILAALGPLPLAEIALYPLRNAYRLARLQHKGWAAWRQALRTARPTPPPAWESYTWTFAGDLVDYDRDGRDLTLRCENASIRLTILAPDLVRVRLSPGGDFPAPFSYAVVKLEDSWPPAAYQVEEGEDALLVRTERLQIRIARRPCRLAFLDPAGQEVQADAEGLGWCGPAVVASKLLSAEEHIYGLGDKAFGLDRRGRSYEMWNADPHGYGPGQDPLYLNIPFYLGLRGALGYGLLFDNSHRAQFDLGANSPRRLRFAAAGGELRYYYFYGPDLRTVLARYAELTGRPPLPPLWALGYHQSRWSYYPEARVHELAKQLRGRGIPCDALHLDIHYMRGHRAFTWHPRRFPNPARLVADLRAAGFRTVVTLDPAIKADRRDGACRSGLDSGAFARYPDGTLFSGPVWPGNAYFPDFTSPEGRQWWADQCRALWADVGVGGIVDDMNEPAVFSPRAGETVPGPVRHGLEGRGGTHAEAHNVYGLQMARATREGWQAWRGAERPWILTRSGYAGVQRYAAHWTGDNRSTWAHLRLAMPMLLGLGLAGLAFAGCDTGGFDGAPDGELMVRWTQLSALTPFFRSHAALWAPPREPWTFDEPYESLIRAAIELRYRLLPYLYTAFWQSSERGLPVMRPLCLEFQADPEAHPLDDQFLLGDSLLVAPVYTPGATSRLVYLPAGTWYRFGTGQRCDGPATIAVDAPLAEVPLFARAGAAVPTWPPMQYVGQRPVVALALHLFPGAGSSWLYEDDGHSLDYQRGEQRVTRLTLAQGPGALELRREAEGPYRPAYSRYRAILHAVPTPPAAVLADGELLEGWSYEAAAATVEVGLGEFERLEYRW